jgi:hypothetical protein
MLSTNRVNSATEIRLSSLCPLDTTPKLTELKGGLIGYVLQQSSIMDWVRYYLTP